MIETRIPTDKKFNFKECKKMFNEVRGLVGDKDSFRNIVDNHHFFSFYKDNKLLGCIYVYDKDNKLFLNGFAGRHHHAENMEAMKKDLSWYNCDIYAFSKRKTAIFCLYELGFKKIDKNLYIYERGNN